MTLVEHLMPAVHNENINTFDSIQENMDSTSKVILPYQNLVQCQSEERFGVSFVSSKSVFFYVIHCIAALIIVLNMATLKWGLNICSSKSVSRAMCLYIAIKKEARNMWSALMGLMWRALMGLVLYREWGTDLPWWWIYNWCTHGHSCWWDLSRFGNDIWFFKHYQQLKYQIQVIEL